MLTRLAAACAAAGIDPAQLRRWLAQVGLPGPEAMPRPLLRALVLVVESWARH